MAAIITYCEHGDFRQQALALLPAIYTLRTGLYHYRSMASKNYRGYLRQDEVAAEKYFYVLRLAGSAWIADGRGAPPMEFERLLAMLNADEAQVRADIHPAGAKRQAPSQPRRRRAQPERLYRNRTGPHPARTALALAAQPGSTR